jgi:hypothetical protein
MDYTHLSTSFISTSQAKESVYGLEKIWDYDLSSMSRQFLLDNESLSADEVEQIELEYRHFMYLKVLYAEALKPSIMVDEYWHNHILNTADYSNFCDEIAGEYIHHRRYITKVDEKYKQEVQDSFARLDSLSLQHFGKQVFSFDTSFLNTDKTEMVVSP